MKKNLLSFFTWLILSVVVAPVQSVGTCRAAGIDIPSRSEALERENGFFRIQHDRLGKVGIASDK